MVVPGPVAVLGDDGRITFADSSGILDPVEAIPEIPWTAFIRVLENGQWYE